MPQLSWFALRMLQWVRWLWSRIKSSETEITNLHPYNALGKNCNALLIFKAFALTSVGLGIFENRYMLGEFHTHVEMGADSMWVSIGQEVNFYKENIGMDATDDIMDLLVEMVKDRMISWCFSHTLPHTPKLQGSQWFAERKEKQTSALMPMRIWACWPYLNTLTTVIWK